MHVFIGQAFSTLTIYKKPINGQRPSFTKSSAKKKQKACTNKWRHQRAWFYLCFCALGTKLMAAQPFTVCSSTAEGGRLSHCICPSFGSLNRVATSQLIRGKCCYAPWGRACDRLPVCMIPPWALILSPHWAISQLYMLRYTWLQGFCFPWN